MEIRPALPCDLNALEEIEKRCFTRERFPRDFLNSMLVDEGFVTYLIQEGESVLGAASMLLMEESMTARLITLAVVPEHRCRGAGRLLLETLQERAAALGIRRMTLEVNIFNVPGVNLYLHNGFRIVGVFKDYYGKGKDAYYMERRIG